MSAEQGTDPKARAEATGTQGDKATPLKSNGSPKASRPKTAAAKSTTAKITARKPEPPQFTVSEPAVPARLRRRHMAIFVSFLLVVVLPMVVTFWYLHTRTTDQYHSTMSFSVRKEQTNSALDIVGGLSQLSGGSSSDTDVLYQFIQSQGLVAQIDSTLSLRELFQPTMIGIRFSH